MGRFEHGGDVYSHRGAVDFSANVNPLGMPQRVVDALRDHVGDFEAYPDPVCRGLRAALSAAEGVPAGRILCTAGATDLMYRVCAALKPASGLVTAPCFSGYERALEQCGAQVVRHRLAEEDGFGVTEDILSHPALSGEGPRADIVFLCNPNNPTGLVIDCGLLERVLEAARARGAVVVLDECFLDFTGQPSAVALCGRFPNLVVMKAFTKLYAMPGLRLGYGICADEGLLARMDAVGQQWAVSAPAQVAGMAALEEPRWAERTRVYVAAQRAVLEAGLRGCGLRVVPGQANYLLFQSDRDLYAPLLQRGFLIRRCANFPGLDNTWFRIAVRTESENAAFLAALKEVCA